MIDLINLGHGFLRKSLFEGVSLRLMPNERYGIVGANGCGKSTLLRIMAGEFDADEGEVKIANAVSTYRIGQDHTLNAAQKIIDCAMMGDEETFLALKRKDEIGAGIGLAKDAALEIAKLEEVIQRREGYRLRSRAETILEGLGIKSSEHESPLSVLSGGYKWRVFLAQALVKNPQALMLDEPTNHLDIVSIRWLELFLNNYDGMVILVSHDKRFLESVCTQILDIDFATITPYAGNYSAFEKARRLFLLQKEKEIIAQEKEIAQKKAFIDRFRAKASKARQAQSRVKQLEKMEVVEPVRSSRHHPIFRFDILEKGSKDVLEIRNLTKAYGEKVILKDLSFFVQRGEKLAIIGSNGSGKSTLVKAMNNEFKECAQSVKWGFNASVGYFAQDCYAEIKASKDSALDWLWQFCPDKPQSFVQGMLGRVLITKDEALKEVKNLSGGELGRLFLARIMIEKPNVLLLDEPTNHLDLESIESLTAAIAEYAGTLILVSHDRSFIDKTATRILELSDEGPREFLGTYSEFVQANERDYLDRKKEGSASAKKDAPLESSTKISYEEKKKKKALTNKLNRDLEKTMLRVEEIEAQIAAIEALFLADNFFQENDFAAIKKLEDDKNNLKSTLDNLIKDWEQLEQRLNQLEKD